MPLKLASKGFDTGRDMPAKYTCDAENISPPLAWFDVPSATKSLALIVDDPDAPDPTSPQRVWTHWVVYNIPADAAGLLEGVIPDGLPPGTKEGFNDWGNVGYGGPCPALGEHRYFHKLYALDIVLPDLGSLTKADLESAMRNHIIEKAELVGRYQRHKHTSS